MDWLSPDSSSLRERVAALAECSPRCFSARPSTELEDELWFSAPMLRPAKTTVIELPTAVFLEDNKVARCPKGRFCSDLTCKGYHKPAEQRCMRGSRCPYTNCPAPIHIDADQVNKTLVINLNNDDSCNGPGQEDGIYYIRAVVKGFQGIALPAVIHALRYCRFLQMLLVPELEFDIGQHYIRDLILLLDFVPGLEVAFSDKQVYMLRRFDSAPGYGPVTTESNQSSEPAASQSKTFEC